MLRQISSVLKGCYKEEVIKIKIEGNMLEELLCVNYEENLQCSHIKFSK